MTTAIPTHRLVRSKFRSRSKRGFSLVEVVIATGLATYALLVIALLLPMGSGTFQIANQNVVESEIFNKIQLELNATPYYQLPHYFRFSTGSTTFNGSGGTGLSYFNTDGEELISAGGAVPPGTIYFVRCSMPTSAPTGSATPADQTGMFGTTTFAPTSATSGPTSLAVVNVQIGFHIDPNTATATDARVAKRSYVIAKRDTYNGA